MLSIRMLSILLIALSFLFQMPIAQAQEEVSERRQRRAEREAERQRNYEAILERVKEQEFVIEAYEFVDRYGHTVQVNSNTNFIAALDSLGTVQVVLPGSIGGSNGLGGITTEGTITDLEIISDKSKAGVTFRMRVFGGGLSTADMFIDVNSDSMATVRFMGAFGSRFTMRGIFRSWEDSRVFKGMRLF